MDIEKRCLSGQACHWLSFLYILNDDIPEMTYLMILRLGLEKYGKHVNNFTRITNIWI